VPDLQLSFWVRLWQLVERSRVSFHLSSCSSAHKLFAGYDAW
jgi:hypothetical protein